MLGIILVGTVCILSLVKQFAFNRNTLEDNRRILILALFLLVIITGSRNAHVEYGSDLNNYYRLYQRAIVTNNLSEFLMSNTMEIGYLCLNWILAHIIKWPQFIIYFQAIFCYGVTLRFIYKYSTDIMFSFIGFMSLGLMQFYMTGFRQSFAIALCLLAFEQAQKKKLIKYLMLVLLAISMHQTAIVFLPVYFVMRVKISDFNMILDIVLILVVSNFVPQIIDMGNDVFGKEYEDAFVGNQLGGVITLLIGFFVVLLVFYQVKQESIRNKAYMGIKYNEFQEKKIINCQMVHIVIIGLGLYAMRYQAIIMERMSLYFMPMLFILLPDTVDKSFVHRDRRVVRLFLLCMMQFLVYWRFSNWEYVLWWQTY